jgi:hypothetical protein
VIIKSLIKFTFTIIFMYIKKGKQQPRKLTRRDSELGRGNGKKAKFKKAGKFERTLTATTTTVDITSTTVVAEDLPGPTEIIVQSPPIIVLESIPPVETIISTTTSSSVPTNSQTVVISGTGTHDGRSADIGLSSDKAIAIGISGLIIVVLITIAAFVLFRMRKSQSIETSAEENDSSSARPFSVLKDEANEAKETKIEETDQDSPGTSQRIGMPNFWSNKRTDPQEARDRSSRAFWAGLGAMLNKKKVPRVPSTIAGNDESSQDF